MGRGRKRSAGRPARGPSPGVDAAVTLPAPGFAAGEPALAEPAALVFVVDDDARSCNAIVQLLHGDGFRAVGFGEPGEFLASMAEGPANCVVLDERLALEAGLDVLGEMRRRGLVTPVVVVSALGTIRSTVQAMKAGAIDFLQKPVNPWSLLARVREAVTIDREQRAAAENQRRIGLRVDSLTGRQREVMQQLLSARTSREIAADLGISTRTVEGHRRAILQAMGVASLPQLLHLLARAGLVARG